MRYKGYVVTYIGESRKVNNDNFFLNGFCKENSEDPFIFDRNKEFRSRNLYALASGAKCTDDGDELSYSVVDILKTFYVADFASVSRELFHVANTAVTSHVLDRTNGHYELDLSVLSIDRDYATVYNMGDIPVFHYENGKLKNLSGIAPKTVELERDYLEGNEVKTEVYTAENVPYIGTLNPNMEVVPYTSVRKKIRKKGYFVLCSREVTDVIDEKTITGILEDKNIKNKHKALAMLDRAIKKEPEGNYTIEVIVVNRGLAIAEDELKVLGKWAVAAGVCIGLCLNGSFLIQQISNLADGIKSIVQQFSSDEEDAPREDLIWIPKDEREKAEKDVENTDSIVDETPAESEQQQHSEIPATEANENTEVQSAEPSVPNATQPAPQNNSKPQNSNGGQGASGTSPQNSAPVSNQGSSERTSRTSPNAQNPVTASPSNSGLTSAPAQPSQTTDLQGSSENIPAPAVTPSAPATPAPAAPVQTPTTGNNELPLSQ